MSFKGLHVGAADSLVTVSTAADLAAILAPSEGTTRYVLDTATLFIYDGATWLSPNLDSVSINSLTVLNQTVLNSTTVEIGDNFIVLNSDVTGAPTEDAGILIERGTSADATLQWNETTDRFEATGRGAIFYGIDQPTFKRTLETILTVPADCTSFGRNPVLLTGAVISIAAGGELLLL